MIVVIPLQGYHLLALMLFAPALILQPTLLIVSLAIAVALLLVLEALRISGIPRIAPKLHTFMTSFIDERDSGNLLVSLETWCTYLSPAVVRAT